MKLKLIEGIASTLQCRACGVEGAGGTEPYASAATGETLEPQKWYTDGGPEFGPYCEGCAAKIAEAEDPTRSVTQFYSNTTGATIEPEHL
jgi:hypothetical protein